MHHSFLGAERDSPADTAGPRALQGRGQDLPRGEGKRTPAGGFIISIRIIPAERQRAYFSIRCSCTSGSTLYSRDGVKRRITVDF